MDFLISSREYIHAGIGVHSPIVLGCVFYLTETAQCYNQAVLAARTWIGPQRTKWRTCINDELRYLGRYHGCSSDFAYEAWNLPTGLAVASITWELVQLVCLAIRLSDRQC